MIAREVGYHGKDLRGSWGDINGEVVRNDLTGYLRLFSKATTPAASYRPRVRHPEWDTVVAVKR